MNVVCLGARGFARACDTLEGTSRSNSADALACVALLEVASGGSCE